MIADLRVRRARGDGRSLFVVGYVDLEKKGSEGLLPDDKIRNRGADERAPKSCGVSDVLVDLHFARAKRLILPV